jgi:sodium-dependent dicarboxylate transporter 2/3/5
MIPAAMSASCAFMLPVATGPNAVIFASGHVSIKSMFTEGLALNFIGAAVITAVCFVALAS